MYLGLMSDTHDDRNNALEYVIRELTSGIAMPPADIIMHSGDIVPKFIDPALFANLPLCCALTDEQVKRGHFMFSPLYLAPPAGWDYTRPNDRIRILRNPRDLTDIIKVYNGHKRTWEILFESLEEFYKTRYKIRMVHETVRWLFSGHTHRQVFLQDPNISLVNPGSVELSAGILGGYEFAWVDTVTEKVIFSRIPQENNDQRKLLNIAIISDSYSITKKSGGAFWSKLVKELKRQKVTHLIHCGNIFLQDVGLAELNDFEVYYYLRQDQLKEAPKAPGNWHLLSKEQPLVDIGEYHFYVHLELGSEIFDKSEMDMHRLSQRIKTQYPKVKFLLFGNTNTAFLEEGENLALINPGDIENDQSFVVVKLPLAEITFDRIIKEPKPKLVA